MFSLRMRKVLRDLWSNKSRTFLVVLSIAGMLGCSANVFAFYLLASGRSRSNALISFVTAVITLITSAAALL